MPGFRLTERTDYIFNYETQVRIKDVNYGNHLDSASILSIIHDARVHLLNDLGLNEGDLGDGKTGIVLKDMVTNFRAEAFWGDNLLVSSAIDEISDHEFRIFHRITRKGKTIVLAETGIVPVDIKEKKKSFVPEEFINAVKNYAASNL